MLFIFAFSSDRTKTVRAAIEQAVEENFTGFVFKIQANMDPKHRDRIAFMRIVSGKYSQGMKMNHVRIGKQVSISDAVTFMAGDRERAAYADA